MASRRAEEFSQLFHDGMAATDHVDQDNRFTPFQTEARYVYKRRLIESIIDGI